MALLPILKYPDPRLATKAATVTEFDDKLKQPVADVVPPPCPVQWLAGFAKIELEPGEERRVVLRLDETAFRKWDATLHCWRIYPGEYEVRVASSSRDVRLAASIAVGDGLSAFNPEQARRRHGISEEQSMSDQALIPSLHVPEIYRHPIPGCFTRPESARAAAHRAGNLKKVSCFFSAKMRW